MRTLRIGLLYPTRDCGEDDFLAFARLLDPEITVRFAYTEWGESVNRLPELDARGKLDALREVGEPGRLTAAAGQLAGFEPQVVSWACTSCSFLWGLDGARHQATVLSELLGIPASSTSLAFAAAARALGVTRIGLGSVYGTEVTAAFVDFLAAAGVSTVHHVAMDASSDRELATWDRARLLDLVADGDAADAEAVLVPETALHTADLIDEFETLAGKPVLTATQVTLWHALRLLGRTPRGAGTGTLFSAG
ncbi:maleate cis-trans isomerase family protein [Amycolatopsis sp. CA-230715]|uniref:maleate cis-trans isomerase family protein n=1 Tax=Amycolatopsis sp. CA-230715 TaxID=2745196 RepID=UPI001C328646|nr:decarboxylase [Amycolatopsis sp. CA-230715]QWF86039.1 Maleate isomerase [Amycolatopsis sp. CA-230715]